MALLLLMLAGPVLAQGSESARDIATLADKERSLPERRAALRRIQAAGRGAISAVPTVLAVLRETELAPVAVETLRAHGKEILPQLMRALGSPWDDPSGHVAGLLLAIGEPALPVLIERAVGASPNDQAIQALVKIGKPAVPALVRRLESGLRGDHAARVLGLMGDVARPALPALRTAYRDAGSYMRGTARVAIARITPDRAEALQLLRAEIADDWPDHEALALLGGLGPDARAALPRLRELADGMSTDAIVPVLRAIWQIEGDANAVLPALIEVLTLDGNRRKTELQIAAAVDLVGEMGPAGRPASPVILHALALMYLSRSEAVWDVLTRTGLDPAVVPRLRLWLRTGSWDARRVALDAVVRLGAEAEAALPDVAALVAGEVKPLRAQAVETLQAVKYKHWRGARAAEKALLDADEDLACKLLEYIGKMGFNQEETVVAVRKAYVVPGRRARVFAIWAFQQMGEQGAAGLPEMRDAFKSKDEELRDYAVAAIKMLGPLAAAAVPDLEKVVAGAPSKFSIAAAHALAQVRGSAAEPALARLGAAAFATEEFQRDGVWMLAWVGPSERRFLPRLLALLDAKEPRLRVAAAHAVARIGKEYQRASRALRRVILGKHRPARIEAYWSVQYLGASMSMLRPVLEKRRLTVDAEERAALDRALATLD